jgi:hypothetical protein
MYFAFGFRDAGQVRKLDMKCQGEAVPFRTQGQYIKAGVCTKCPSGMSCASGKPMKLKIAKVMAWNTGQKTHDRDLDQSFSKFTTNAASLIDTNPTGTGINVVSNYFWWFGVQLSAECYKAKFTFYMASNLHHLRTAYSQDGNTWTCRVTSRIPGTTDVRSPAARAARRRLTIQTKARRSISPMLPSTTLSVSAMPGK